MIYIAITATIAFTALLLYALMRAAGEADERLGYK